MSYPLKHVLIAGAVSISLLSACSKSALVTPVEQQNTAVPNEKNGALAPLTLTPVGSVAYTSNGLTVVFTNNYSNLDDALRQRMVNTFFSVYPQLRTRFNTNAATSVTFIMDPNYNGVAATSGTVVRYSASYFQTHASDIDVVTHEIMHIVQAYTGGAPGWLTEGIADYVRYKYGVDNAGAGWSLPNWSSSQSYTDAYRVTARFLVWIERHGHPSIVNDLNTRLRNHTYTSSTWSTLTGETVDQLWADYSANPAL
ncbi:secretory protein [Chitinophaga agrisoli]|uniref:Secretory protein n=1 Tax=Chitinophaga agrisoli TaxID=2607653 RepID=A0A5B2VL81_9BACT|nr:basic secretory protein-like protein [Chitinophaga agrisoli]KAA2238939.1 secretory protein [Chitinophaga agrisoli]